MGPLDHPRSNAFRLPFGLLGMLGLVLAVEASITARRLDLVGPWVEDWRRTGQAARSEAKGAQVLFFGDSLVKFSLLPQVVASKTGRRAYNLATNAGTMASSYFLFRQALDSGARPTAVVADFVALMSKDEGPPRLLNYAELGTLRDCLDLAWTARDPNFLGNTALGKVFPSCHFRHEVRASIRAALDGRSSSARPIVEPHLLLWARAGGAQPNPSGRVHIPGEETLIDEFCPEGWSCPPVDLAYLERFLALAESRHIPVFWLIPPMAPEVHARRALRGADDAYDRFVRSVLARHPKAVVLDARDSGYDDLVHVDYLHLNVMGAAVLSADVAAVLADRWGERKLLGAGWVDLPDRAGRVGDTPSRSLARARDSTRR